MGSELDNKTEAAKLNRQVDALLAKLEVCRDSTYYYTTVVDIVKTAVSCDEYDNLPNANGKSKAKYRQANARRTGTIWVQLVNAGAYYHSQHQEEKALAAYELYVQTAEHPLFDKQPHHVGMAAYYAGRLAYGIKDYQKAERYADIALKDDGIAKKAAALKVDCMRQLAQTDSDWRLYEAALTALYERDTHSPHYFNLLVMYYTEHGKKEALEKFVENEIQRNGRNKYAWALKGERAMNAHRWQEAIQAYSRAAALDSLFLPVIYNIGICYTSEAVEMTDSLTRQGNESQTPDATTAVMALFRQGKIYLEKAQVLDPKRSTVDWAPPLYQVYFALGDERAEEMRKLIKY